MRKIIYLLLISPFFLFGQGSYNMTLLGSYEWPSTEGNDIWGWVDPSGNEYALVGLVDGFACVNVTNPSNLIEEFYISDISSTWRDVKTWGNYAYVTTDVDQLDPAGLLIIDLSDMSGNTYWHMTSFSNPQSGNIIEFNAAHNLYIDENGICYIFGASNTSGGNTSDGVIFLDVAANPINPVYLGEWDDEYIHDGMVRGDTLYAGCIYQGELYIIDVSNKSNPIVLGTHQTPNVFTHNAWISDDGNYVFTTDEKADSYIASYDISDISNIQEVDRVQSNPESNSIVHNTHVDGNFLVTSWYRDGTVVHDISNPENLIQVAYYDSYNGGGNLGPNDGFDGCWGTYPFLPSGNIISSDINSGANGNGRLLVYERGFTQACYLEGLVTDGITALSLSSVDVEILNTIMPQNTFTNLSGFYDSGNADSGIFDVVFSKIGYISDTLQVNLVSGQTVILDAALYPDPNVSILGCMDSLANNYNPNANLSLDYGGEVNNSFSTGDYFNGNQYLIFDAYTDLFIKSAIFYAEDSVTVTFELRSSNGVVLDDTTHVLIQGQQQLDLNFEVLAGNNMQLGISNGNSGLYRNDNGASYPYNIGSIMNITGSSATSAPDYYYFYYNIEVEVPCSDISNLSWDCGGEASCFDPGNGSGQYNTLAQCESNCIPLNLVQQNKFKRTLIRIVDVLGRDINQLKNTPLFYIYNDGTVEKKILIE